MVKVLVRTLVISLAVSLLVPRAALAAGNRVIVEAITNSTGDETLDPLSAGFSDLLVAYLSGYDDLEILYREDMHRIWQELSRSRSGLAKKDTLATGALIGADTLIKGGFVKINGTFQANVHVYDTATTELRFSLQDSGRIERVDTLAASIAERIAAGLAKKSDARKSVSVDVQPVVNTHFMKGLGYYFNGLYDHSVAEFMQVIDLDPARADARLWLGRSYAAGGEDDHAQIEYRRFLRDFPDHEDANGVRTALETERQ